MDNVRENAIRLRKKGLTYSEICKQLQTKIAKGTLSYWFRGVQLDESSKKRIADKIRVRACYGRVIALKRNKELRIQYFKEINNRVTHLKKYLKRNDIAKIVLAVLYATEGGKNRRGYLTFGNSDSRIIKLFLKLLRQCYDVREDRLRCTVQCRADQGIQALEEYWRDQTGVSKERFYKAQVDKRTRGKPSRKKEYKGVCRIDYFSADVYHELRIIGEILLGPIAQLVER